MRLFLSQNCPKYCTEVNNVLTRFVCGPVALPVSPEPRGPRSSRVLLSLLSSLGDLIRQSGDLPLISQHGWL